MSGSPRRRPDFLGPEDLVVVFDGVCHLCNGGVKFLIARDPQARLRLTPFQSQAGRAILTWAGLPTDHVDTMVFVERGRVYTKSEAVSRIAGYLSWPWPVFKLALLVPPVLRNWLYDRIARNRYNLFGKEEACLMPSPDVARRFLIDPPRSERGEGAAVI